MVRRVLYICIFMMLLASVAYANVAPKNCTPPDKGFWSNPAGRGWFWGQEECKPEPEEEKKAETDEAKTEWKLLPKKANIPWELLDQIDPDEIAKKIEPEARKVSIMYPTEENIFAYRKLNNWIIAKSASYATMDERTRTENPVLMPWNERLGTTGYKEDVIFLDQERQKTNILRKYKDRAGLVIYVSPTCKYCEKQVPMIDKFVDSYGWDVIYRDVTVNKYKNEVAQMNVTTTPDIFIVLKGIDGKLRYQRIATGLTTIGLLETAVIKGLSYLGEDIDETLVTY